MRRRRDDLVAAALEQFGRLDILINNASSFYPTPVGKITSAQWDDLMGSNLRAPLFLSQAAAPSLRAAARTHHQHRRHPWPAAAEGLPGVQHRQGGARDADPLAGARTGPRYPGQRHRAGSGALAGDTTWTRQLKREIIGKTALKRHGSPQDIARTALFLAKDAPYITGQIIAVDGGTQHLGALARRDARCAEQLAGALDVLGQRPIVAIVGDALAHPAVQRVGLGRARARIRLQIVGLRRRQQLDRQK